MSGLSHVDDQGRARMVDVGRKPLQGRTVRGNGMIFWRRKRANSSAKTVSPRATSSPSAQIAGIQAAKRTAELIPLCHPLSLDHVAVTLELSGDGVHALSEVSCVGRTGVEMEALTAVAVALLAVYDMCKAVDRGMHIGKIRLLEKIKTDVVEH